MVKPKLDNIQGGFRRGRSTIDLSLTLQQIWEILGACQRRMHMLGRPRESIWLGSSWKALGDVTGIRCWRVPLAGRQVTVFLLKRLCPCRRSQITTVQCWCWTPTMVCAVTTPLHSLCQASPHYGPRAKTRPAKPFHLAAKYILPIMKK